jgi:hypothetical protein
MSETPRTDSFLKYALNEAPFSKLLDLARQLERELAEKGAALNIERIEHENFEAKYLNMRERAERAEVKLAHPAVAEQEWRKLVEAQEAQLKRYEADNAALKSRLEVEEGHPYDGISCRDETIRLQDERIDKLEADNKELREDAKFGEILMRYIDRLTDPTDDDTLTGIIGALSMEVSAAIDAARARTE